MPQKNLVSSSISIIEEKLSYAFSNKKLLLQAFTHKSYLNEASMPNPSNERLEFLGDAVLNLFVSKFLFSLFPEKEEGELSKLKAHLVCQESCLKMVEQLNVFQHIFVSKGEKHTLSRTTSSLASDLFEAIIGAIFLDGGWDVVSKFLYDKYSSFFTDSINLLPLNAKAELQESLAKIGKPCPEYRVVHSEGPSHDKEFTIVVYIDGKSYASASGKSKKEAQQKAAELTLFQITQEHPFS
jgi:ribonuclease III